MQKYFTQVLFVLLFAYTATAQNSAPYWSLSGNNNATSSSKLGTTNNIPLRLFTNNAERIHIDGLGKVGIGTTAPRAKLTLQNNGGAPSTSWLGAANPIFAGFGESAGGSTDFYLAMASGTTTSRPNFIGRRARGTLAAPLAVINNDYISSFQASGYDGSAFQNAANVDFFVDGTPSSGNVPMRISFSTGSNLGSRTERLTIKSTGNVGIGTTSPTQKLHVIGSGLFSNGLTISNGGTATTNTTGVGLSATGFTYGVYGVSNYDEDDYAGVYGRGGYTGVHGNSGVIGVYGIGGSYGILGDGIEVGVVGGSTNGIGVSGNSSNSYGVYGYTSSKSSYAGYFVGNVYSTGVYTGSDKSLKEDLKEMSGAMDIIKKLKPQSYTFKQDGNYASMNLPSGRHYGLIAQDIEQVLPELVKNTAFDLNQKRPGEKPSKQTITPEKISFKAVNYTELIPILVGALQEQQQQIENQEAENDALLKRIEKLEQMVNKLANGPSTVPLSNAFLGSANPNPGNGLTIISYNVPEGSKTAYLMVSDMKGSTIKRINISGKGNSQLQLNTASLAAGTYTYSLVVDGTKVDSKQLLIAR